MRAHQPKLLGHASGRAVREVRYSLAHPAIGPLLYWLGVAIFIRPVMELIPGFADDVFSQGRGYLTLVSSRARGYVFWILDWLAGAN